MKLLNNLAALSLSMVLALMPFAVIAVDDVAAANPVHALGMEGR
jgi:hypothetical protein